jgi:hypothetical protein
MFYCFWGISQAIKFRKLAENPEDFPDTMQIQFNYEQQKRFLDYAMQNLNLNLRELGEKFKVKYEIIKKYHQEKCCLPEKFFLDICKKCKINSRTLDVSYLERNWGQVLGGKRGFQTLKERYAKRFVEWRARGGRNSKNKWA